MSYDAPKIASELLLKSFVDKVATEYDDKPTLTKQIRNRRYVPNSFLIGDYLPKIHFDTQQFQDIYEAIQNSYDSFKYEFVFRNFNGSHIKVSIGNGGIHTIQGVEKHVSGKKYIIDIDAGSMYPNLLKGYKFISPEIIECLEVFSEVIEKRMIAKKNKDATTNEILKLVLNSTIGLLDNTHSWLYSPEQVLALRLTGQLSLLRILELCYEKKIEVFSLNTDGLTMYIEEHQENDIKEICDKIMKEFPFEMERADYEWIYYSSVNDYIALTKEGKIKTKGEFIYDHILDGSNEFTIIPLAIKEFLVNQIPIAKTIKENTELWRFCTQKKVDRKYNVWFNGKKTNHLNRFYISKKGAYLYKSKDDVKMECMLKDTPILICNEDIRYAEIDSYPIDYQWYINKTQEKLDKFFPKQQSLFE